MVAALFIAVVVTFYTIQRHHHHQSINQSTRTKFTRVVFYVPGLVRLLLYVIRFGVVQFLGCTGLVSCWGFGVSFDTTSCRCIAWIVRLLILLLW